MFPETLERVLDVLDQIVQIACVVLLSAVAFAVTFQVIARYLVSVSTPWTGDLAAIAFVWLSMLAIALGVRRGRHMVLDIFEYLPARRWLSLTVALVSGLAVIAVLAVLVYFGSAGLEAAFSRRMPGLRIPNGWMSLGVPVGCSIALIFAIESLWRTVTARPGEDRLPTGVLFSADDEIVVKGEI